MMNPEFTRQPRQTLPVHTGQASNGGRPNRPTIVNQKCGTPAPNLNPSFETTPYNNSMQSQIFPVFTTFVENTVNPIGRTNNAPHMGATGLAGAGTNSYGAGYKPLNKSPYNLNTLGAISGKTQEFPYLTSQLYAQGMIDYHATPYYGINQGDEETYIQGTDIPRGMASISRSVAPVNAVNTAQRMAVNRLNANRIYNQRDAQDRRQMSAPVQMQMPHMQMVYN
jgi:hypothetical protein